MLMQNQYIPNKDNINSYNKMNAEQIQRKPKHLRQKIAKCVRFNKRVNIISIASYKSEMKSNSNVTINETLISNGKY